MGDINVSVEINSSPESVWNVIERIEDHVNWMSEAVAIRFETDRTRGTGTAFLCDTKVGPIKLVDRMEITEWVPWQQAVDSSQNAARMGVDHKGLVTGTGTFVVQSLDGGRRTQFSWSEQLHFPWFLGGRLGEMLGGRLVLTPIWKRNLRTLRRIVEAD